MINAPSIFLGIALTATFVKCNVNKSVGAAFTKNISGCDKDRKTRPHPTVNSNRHLQQLGLKSIGQKSLPLSLQQFLNPDFCHIQNLI